MATSPFMQKVRMELRTHQYSVRTEKTICIGSVYLYVLTI